jgi:hypothetical protein
MAKLDQDRCCLERVYEDKKQTVVFSRILVGPALTSFQLEVVDYWEWTSKTDGILYESRGCKSFQEVSGSKSKTKF